VVLDFAFLTPGFGRGDQAGKLALKALTSLSAID